MTGTILESEQYLHNLILRMVFVTGGGHFTWTTYNNENMQQNKIAFKNNAAEKGILRVFIAQTTGEITFNSTNATEEDCYTIYCEGDCERFCVSNSGVITVDTSNTNRMRFVDNGVTNNYKYYITNGGSISTGNSGTDYFPGTGSGYVQEETYSWYL